MPSTGHNPHTGITDDSAITRLEDGPNRRAADFRPLEDARFPPGQIFAARYRIVSLLGRGATGEEVPSLFHVPPKKPAAAPMSWGGVPAASTFFSRPPATNPIDRLSGDQNGCAASSVPASFQKVTDATAMTRKSTACPEPRPFDVALGRP